MPDKIAFKKHYLRNINTLCLPGSRSCSLACKYCYAGYDKFSTSPDQGISYELIDKSLDFLVDELNPFHPPMLVIGFGGDPIEAMEFIEYAKKRTDSVEKYNRVKIALSTTHGQNLNDRHIEFLEKNVGFLSFSLDGTRETNQKNRVSRNPQIDSYDRVLKSYAKVKDRLFCSVNGTVTPEGNLAEDLEHLYDIGFRTITFLPVRPGESDKFDLDSSSTHLLKRQYSNLIAHLQKLPDEKTIGLLTSLTSDDYFNKFLARLIYGGNAHRKCGAAFSFLYVASDGEITPCSSFRPYLGKQYVLGTLDTGIDLDKIEPLFSFSTLKTEPCKSCEVESICSGFCFFNSLQTSGDILKPVQEECALAIHVIKELRLFYNYLKDVKPNILEAYKEHNLKIKELDDKYYG